MAFRRSGVRSPSSPPVTRVLSDTQNPCIFLFMSPDMSILRRMAQKTGSMGIILPIDILKKFAHNIFRTNQNEASKTNCLYKRQGVRGSIPFVSNIKRTSILI